MSLMCYEPWALLNQLQGEVGGVSDRRTARRSQYQHLAAASDGVPALDIREADARYLIHADLPGVEPAVIEVSMEDGVLSIKVERGTEHEEQRRSCRIACNAGAICARFRRRVLDIVIPKQQKPRPERIRVEA